MSNKPLIAVWGNPGSGKTLTTIKLAKALAAKKQNVLILCCDALCPSTSTILPQAAKQQRSLGELLSLPSLTQEELLRYALPLDDSPHIALIGYKKGDTAYMYASYNRERAVDLLTLARHLADVILVDCSSYLSADPLSTIALELADTVFRLHSCELKSLMFYASYLPLLTDLRFRRSLNVSVLSNVKVGQNEKEYSQVFGGIEVTLPYVTELEQQTADARLLDDLSGKDAKTYLSGVEHLIQLALPEEHQQVAKSKDKSSKTSTSNTTTLNLLNWLKSFLPKRRGDGQ
ncbi:hypothetical protein [Paenibacillus donghaensis]|uniref:AAA+ ATPase domain-containing protein n=1 Tax=Paenibacillus donghaensis TaxID=414771 RepID=A0A2Z2KUI0_9BACL|nr:hypothetical protein [Paenibacillus donghaensis]ASA23408.1 hypothetical protein B9T62_22935 [Paenibacillus donghaensis]